MTATILRFAAAAFCALSLMPARAHAQARGAYSYIVQGFYMGEEMQPWDARLEVRDTVLDGKPAVSVTHHSRNVAIQPRFTSTAAWTTDLRMVRSAWSGAGAEPGSCRVDVDNGTGNLFIGEDKPSAVSMGEHAIPEFAMAAAAAAMSLKDGDTIRLRGYRCSWSASTTAAMSFFDFTGTVTSDTMKRAGAAAAEPVWVVTGSQAYPYTTWIAKTDHVILKTVIPQGTDGQMVETLSGAAGRQD